MSKDHTGFPGGILDIESLRQRASAATVAEPSELEMHRADYQAIRAAGFHDPGELLDAYKKLQAAQQQAEPESVIKRQAQKIGELIADRDSWIEAHAHLYRLYHDQSPKAGEEIHVNVEGGDVYTLPLQLSGMDKPRFVVHVPCSPQAEPGADERADAMYDMAFVRGMQMGWNFGENGAREDYDLALKARDGYVKVLRETRAAQSGQRAGLAPLERIRELATEGMCHGLLADDKCREILEALNGNAISASNASAQKKRTVTYVCPVCNATLERKE
ncbi:hypothetical protein [Ralstonia mannitolilytica]|uniref:hypothetical protein n=1 Tax=Ralstonia mannitolilytica TaxID=105219 RepID=UPI003747E45C